MVQWQLHTIKEGLMSLRCSSFLYIHLTLGSLAQGGFHIFLSALELEIET